MKNNYRKNLTLSLEDKFQFFNTPDRYKIVAGNIIHHLKKLKHSKIEIYPEITNNTGPGLGGRIHFHGWISYDDHLDFLCDDLKLIYEVGRYSTICTNFEGKLSEKYETWAGYVFKDKDIMIEWTKKKNAPYKLTLDTSICPIRKNSKICKLEYNPLDNGTQPVLDYINAYHLNSGPKD